jgi:hypothetical protein
MLLILMRESVKYITQYIFLLLTSPLILPPPLDDITVSKKSKTSHECEKIKFYFTVVTVPTIIFLYIY